MRKKSGKQSYCVAIDLSYDKLSTSAGAARSAIKSACGGRKLHDGGESPARDVGSLAADSAPRPTPSCRTRTFSPGAHAPPSDALSLSSPCSKPPSHKRAHSISALFHYSQDNLGEDPEIVRFASYNFLFSLSQKLADTNASIKDTRLLRDCVILRRFLRLFCCLSKTLLCGYEVF